MVVRVDDPRVPKGGRGKSAAPGSEAWWQQQSQSQPGFTDPGSPQVDSWTPSEVAHRDLQNPERSPLAALGRNLGSPGSRGADQGDVWAYQYKKPYHSADVARPDKPMDFSDYLALAQQYLNESGAGAPDYSAIEDALQQKALQSDARLQALYQKLHGSIAADAPTIAGQYDQAAASINDNADQAAGNVNGAYQASRDAQTQQLAALGIQDAVSVLAANGGNAAADQAHAVGNIEQNRQTGTQQAALNKGSALDYNTNIGNASSVAGSEARSSIQNQLMDALAQIALRKSEAQSSSGKSSIDLAMQLQDRASAGQPTVQDQQDFAKFTYQQQQDLTDTYLRLLKQYNGDEKHAAQVLAQLMASG